MQNKNELDYKTLYDGYWQRSDRVGERSSDLKKTARLIAETCGYGSAIDIGCGEGYLIEELLSLDIDVVGMDISSVVVERANARWKNRFFEGSVLSIPFPDEHFNAVVSTDCLEHLAPEDVPAALREMYRVSSRYVFLQIATTPDRDGHWHLTIEGRAWWEDRCFEAGFRKHPLYYYVNDYEALNKDGWQVFVILEKIPAKALVEFDLSVLEEEKMLHNDMLRVTGRRSDAHCIRYYKACDFIRPGDQVLDVACGLGYGSHILYNVSKARSVIGVDLSDFGIAYAQANYGQQGRVEFRCGDAQALSSIPDNSIDFIAAFETIEHVPEPMAYLRELKRVLKPSGRVMVCAPNNWVDETGKDPNPHHFHVYTWDRLVAEVGQLFLLEQGFLQTAGGALKCPNGSRKWVNVPADVTPEQESEWVLLLGMADPLEGKGIPYEETAWRLPEDPSFNVAAFARDYQNPWLLKGMVTIGMRMGSKERLADMQERVLASYDPESVDYGAALCGRIYFHIEQPETPETAVKALEEDVRRYASISLPTAHHIRWQVSLLFAAGELARKQGRTGDASFFYSECAKIDVLPYSPILGNKTLDALFCLARFALQKRDLPAAKQYLLRSIDECQRLSSGSWVNITGEQLGPLPFGLAEMSQLFDKAARAAYLLSALDKADLSPHLLFRESTGFFERQIIHYKNWGNEYYEYSNRLLSDRKKFEVERMAGVFNLRTAEGGKEGGLERVVKNTLWRYSQFAEVRSELGLGGAIRHTFGFLRDKLSISLASRLEPHVKPPEGKAPSEASIGFVNLDSVKACPAGSTPQVIMLVDAFHDGGVERVVIDLCLNFRQAGIQCKILVAKDGGRSAAEARSHGIDVMELHQNTEALRSALAKSVNAVAITHHCYFSLDSFREAGIPVLEVIHNAYYWQRGNRSIADMRRNDICHFIAVSGFVAKFSTEELGIDAARLSLINNGLNNLDLIRPPLDLLRKNRLETRSAPVLLHIANLHPQKNHRLIVKSFARIKQKYPDARLVMAGSMDGYPDIFSKLNEDIERLGVSGSVTLAGALSRRDLSKLMASTHVGILPSVLEGFSIATLELSFFGLPAILSATGAAQELQEAYGHVHIAQACALSQKELDVRNVDVFLTAMPDSVVDSLTEATLKVLDEYPEYLGKALNAAEQFAEYSIDSTVGKYISLLQSMRKSREYV